MGKHENKPELVGPWRSLHAAIWMIGVGVIAWSGSWWPGIVILAGISMALEAILVQVVPQAFDRPDQSPQVATPPSPASPGSVEALHPVELLPAACPNCGGPLRGHEAKWAGSRAANCPYCGANIVMKMAR